MDKEDHKLENIVEEKNKSPPQEKDNDNLLTTLDTLTLGAVLPVTYLLSDYTLRHYFGMSAYEAHNTALQGSGVGLMAYALTWAFYKTDDP